MVFVHDADARIVFFSRITVVVGIDEEEGATLRCGVVCLLRVVIVRVDYYTPNLYSAPRAMRSYYPM